MTATRGESGCTDAHGFLIEDSVAAVVGDAGSTRTRTHYGRETHSEFSEEEPRHNNCPQYARLSSCVEFLRDAVRSVIAVRGTHGVMAGRWCKDCPARSGRRSSNKLSEARQPYWARRRFRSKNGSPPASVTPRHGCLRERSQAALELRRLGPTIHPCLPVPTSCACISLSRHRAPFSA